MISKQTIILNDDESGTSNTYKIPNITKDTFSANNIE
jgi:hypothetical protein